MNRLIYLSLFLLPLQIQAQNNTNRIYHMNPDKIKVYGSNGEMDMAWSGGFNNPQYAMADLNKDGKNDLVVFERYTHVRTFINMSTSAGIKFKYAPAYENSFVDIRGYIKLLDYNHDNIPDLWHWGYSGLGLCKGYYNAENRLAFDKCKDIRWGNNVNIGINSSDMPDMRDVDGDGDIDIITYSQWGSLIEWYKNMQTEYSLPNDDVAFNKVDKCWGRTLQIEDKRERELGFSCNMKEVPQNKTTGGSHGLCLFDADGDGDYDLLDGTYNTSDVQFLRNGRNGGPIDTMVAQDTMWQSNGRKVDIKNFVIGYWLDVNTDGAKDLLFSHLLPGENYKTTSYYQNIGSNANPNFKFQSDDIFTDEMIDLGSDAFPLLYDYNKDGKLDLLIGSSGYFNPDGVLRSKISYYKNTSDAGQLSFSLETTDFLNISTEGFVGAALAIGDLSGDGVDDLVIGRTDGTLRFYRNVAASNSDVPDWKQTPENLAAGSVYINVGGNAAPLLYDFDQDGDKDLIIGNKSGKLSYYRNLGNAVSGKPSLSFVTDNLGAVSVVPQYDIYGNSMPCIGKLDNTGKEYLLVGNKQGIISRYSFQHGNTTTAFQREDSVYSDLEIPERFAAPAISDLDGDGKYEMMVGTGLGGVVLFEQMFNLDVAEVNARPQTLELFPNPVRDVLNISVRGRQITGNAVFKMYNRMGQVVDVNASYTNTNYITVDVSMLPAGVYLCSLTVDGTVHTSSFIRQ